jgi:hypothetical protein
MTVDGRRELPEGTWCVRVALEPEATDEPALQFAVFSEDPRLRFKSNLETLEALDRSEAGGSGGGRGRLCACWSRAFRTIPGDRVYMVTRAGDIAVTTSEQGGRKWLATKGVHRAEADSCWCIPFDAEVGHVVQIALDSANRTDLTALAEKDRGA